MFSHIWMKVGRKLPYEELQNKVDFRHGWPTFSWVIALFSKFVFRTFLGHAFTYLNKRWKQASIWRVTDQVRLLSRLTYFFHELLPFVQNSFSGLFSAMLSDIWMKVGSKLPYEELQIKFDFCHGWPTFSRVTALCSKIVFRTFLCYAFTYLNESW